MAELHFELEQAQWARGARLVAGVDEVGRGPLAGPVVAAAVVLNPEDYPSGLRDSKKLSAAKRDLLAQQIHASAAVGIGLASVEEIDRINILQATYLAMRRALAALPETPDHALIDGNRLPPDLPCPGSTQVKGDAISPSIAAASIIAKSWRDGCMAALAQQFPGYGWETNAGYPSAGHKSALMELGVTPHHRRSFKPIHIMLYQD